MVRRLIISTVSFLLIQFVACDDVGDIINPYDPPELDAAGIILSANNVAPKDTVTASINATNPEEGPLSYQWSSGGSGRFIEPSDSSTVRWIAPLQGGTYTIKVKVSNAQKYVETSKNVVVIKLTEPLVSIIEPEKNTYFIQGEEIRVKAFAYHDNKVTEVRLFVNGNTYDDPKGYNSSDSYEFIFIADSTMIGLTTIKVEAENTAGIKGADSITVKIEGIIVGKNAD